MKRLPVTALILCWILLGRSAWAEHHVDLLAIINLPALQGALLQIDRDTRLVQAGDHFEDKQTKGAHFEVEVVDLDLAKETVKTRIAGEDFTNCLPLPNRPAAAQRWIHLQNVACGEALELVARVSGRVILLHPAVSQAAFSCEASWTEAIPSQAEITERAAKWFQQRDAAVLEDGATFLQIIPATMVQTATLRAKDLPAATDIPNGTISFNNVPASEVVDIYGRLVGRSRAGHEPVTGTISYFQTSRPLSKAQVTYALETLLAWNGNHVTLNQDNTFSISK